MNQTEKWRSGLSHIPQHQLIRTASFISQSNWFFSATDFCSGWTYLCAGSITYKSSSNHPSYVRERENQGKIKKITHRLIVRAAWGKTANLCLFPFFRSPLSLLSLFPVASPRAEEWRGEETISPVLVLSCAFRAPLQRSRHLPRTPLVHSKTWNQIPDSGFLIATGPCSLRNTNPHSSYFISIICHPILLSI